MSESTWKQLRRTGLMVWGLGMATYMIVVAGATADVAFGMVSLGVASLGAKFME